MKILLVVHQFFPDYQAGTEVLTFSVARELIKLGHRVRILAGYPNNAVMRDDKRCDEYDFAGIHVYRFHHAYVPMGGQTSMIEIGYDNRLATSFFERVLADFLPDRVHFFHLNRLGTRLIESCVQRGIPCFMTPTDFWTICPTGQLMFSDGALCSGPSAHGGNCVKHFAENSMGKTIGRIARMVPTTCVDMLALLTAKEILPAFPMRKEIRAIESRLGINVSRLNQLSKLVAPNRFIKDLLVRYGVSSELIVESSFGVETVSDAKAVPRAAPSGPLRIGFIGTLATHKGCHTLIEAFKTIEAGKAILKIYGKLEEFPVYVSKLRKLSGGDSQVEFCGTFDNSRIGEIFAGIDVLVVPSLWYENTPLVIYSAQAAFCPVVASALPGTSAAITNEVNGLLFDVGNKDALAAQLSKLISQPSLVERLSKNAVPPKSVSAYVAELLNIWKNA